MNDASRAALRRDLAAIVGEEGVSDGAPDRVAYARDMWPRQQIVVRAGRAAPAPPAVVLWPSSTEQVAAVVRFAAERGLPVVPFGAGSGVCGGVLPSPEAIVLDVKRMARVRRIDVARLRLEAEAGILGQHLEERLSEEGLTLGHFPSSILCSTLGGWIAGRSAGQCSGRYGKIEDMLLGLTFVDGRGEIHRAERDGEGASLLPLLTGSEGILGVVTTATLRLAVAPTERRFASYRFPSVADGLEAIRGIYQAGLRPAVARLYDPVDSFVARMRGARGEGADSGGGGGRLGLRLLVASLRRHGVLGALRAAEHALAPFLGGALLVLLWEDDPDIGRAERLDAHEIALRAGGTDAGEGPARRWLRRRYAVSYRQAPLLAAGGFVDTMEVAAPWSRLLGLHEAVRESLAEEALVMAHFSHAYPDGASIYFTFAGAARSDEEALRRYERAWRLALRAATRAGGVLSHHHGVGRSKAPALRREQGPAIDLVAEAKRLLDPRGVLNPGVLLPEERSDPGGSLEPSPSPLDRWLEADGVLRPADEEQLRAVVAAARAQGRRLWLQGMAPSPEGKETAVPLSLERLDEVIALDERSELVHVQAGRRLEDLERFLRVRGRTLGLCEPPTDESIAAWVARGGAGLPNLDDDPVAPRLVGLEAILPDGRWLRIRPAPRRATGPDLLALFLGARHRLGVLATVHLACPRRSAFREVAWRFASRDAAERALARARGLGVRPMASSLGDEATGNVLLWARLPSEGRAVGRAMVRVLERVARALGGEPTTPAPPAPRGDASVGLDPVLAAWADRLDPDGILAGPRS